jgi:methylmalonyl-CoA/ethylmalonyl-CoA epimerase
MAADPAKLARAAEALPATADGMKGELSRMTSILPEGVKMRFDHVSIAVRSIDRAFDFFQRYFPIRERSATRFSEEQVSGTFNWRDFYLGGFVIELIEDPPGKSGFVTRFIEKHGEGMHHLSIEVNHLAPVLAALKADGVRVVDEQSFPGGAMTAFISPRAAFGTLIQFWQVPDFDENHTHPKDETAHFDHVSIAVRDIGRAMEFFERYFAGRITRAPHLNHRGSFILGNMQVAGFKLEFLQSPGKGSSNDFVGRFIERHGEGMHHISMDLRDFDGTLARLKAGGIRVVDESTNRRGEREFFISPRSAFGALIQVWDMG